jgi:hypothetical protein
LRLLAKDSEEAPKNTRSMHVTSVNFPVAILIAASVNVSPGNSNVYRDEKQTIPVWKVF